MLSRPLLLRLILPLVAVMALIVIAAAGTTYLSGQRAIRSEQTRQLHRLSELVSGWLASADLGPAEVAQLRATARALDTRITLIGGDGKALFDSHADPGAMDNHNARPEIVEARRLGAGTSVRHSATVAEKSVYLARLLNPDDPGGVVLRLSYPRHSWPTLDTPLWSILVAGIAATMLVAGLHWWLLSANWIGPTRALARAAERMAAGDWSPRVGPQGAHELRIFSDKLNALAGSAQRQLEELRDQRGNLQAIIDALPDPLVVADERRHIIHINAPAERVLDLLAHRAIGQHVARVIGDQAVLEMFDAAYGPSAVSAASPDDAAPAIQREIRLHRQGMRLSYQAIAAPTPGGGALLVMRDVTALAQAIQMKTDFVANASHELRTPMAAIKAAFETLSDVYQEDPAQAQRCITIIAEHLRRLEEMLADLLDLSRVEDPELRPHLTNVSVADLFATITSTMGPAARQKRIELHLEPADAASTTRFSSDERLLNLALRNLVENSIKFTPEGGRVSVWVGRDGRSVLLRVSDTGIGIPPEHVDRVFERFYQVNASRSGGGSSGRGTGLGLAIVKHAVAALGGTVRLESVVGRGTSVTCMLPQSADQPEPRRAASATSAPASAASPVAG